MKRNDLLVGQKLSTRELIPFWHKCGAALQFDTAAWLFASRQRSESRAKMRGALKSPRHQTRNPHPEFSGFACIGGIQRGFLRI